MTDISVLQTRRLFKYLFAGCFAFFIGCVSVNLPAGRTERAKVAFRPPAPPFEKAKLEGSADEMWRNPKTGNNISYFTQCGDKSDPELTSIRNELALGLSEYQVLQSDRVPYNGREALRSLISGKVDGIESMMDVIILKKNGCIYGITFVGLSQKLKVDQPAFEKFVREFQAP